MGVVNSGSSSPLKEPGMGISMNNVEAAGNSNGDEDPRKNTSTGDGSLTIAIYSNSMPVWCLKHYEGSGWCLLEIHSTGVTKEYNATVEFYWAPFLLESNSDNAFAHRIPDRIVRKGSINKHGKNWKGADILVFNTYLWLMTGAKMIK